jgi:hypothetical protein
MLTLVIVLPVAVALVLVAVDRWFAGRARPAADQPGRGGDRDVSFFGESLAYVGVLLVLLGGAIAAQQRWLHLSNSERVVILTSIALVLLVAGFAVRWLASPTGYRLTETVWLASAAAAAGATATSAAGVHGQRAGVTVLAASAQLAVYSLLLWFLSRRELLAVVMFAGLVVTLGSAVVVTTTSGRAPWLAVALGLWLLGLAWAVLAVVYPQPLGTSLTVGAAVALLGPAVAVHPYPWVYGIGIVTAAAVMAASIPLKNVVMLAFGSVALFGYLTATVFRFADRTLGAAQTLLIVGGVLICLAAVTVWLGRLTRPPGTTTGRDFPSGPKGNPAAPIS